MRKRREKTGENWARYPKKGEGSSANQGSTGSYARYCDKHIFPVLGISRNEWHWLGDREGDSQPDGGSFQTARNYAKAAYLMLNNGQWVSRVIAAGIWVAFFQGCQQ